MPLVRVDLMEGRGPAIIAELHRRLAEVVAEVTHTPIDRVRTYITEIPPDNWGIGGVPVGGSRAQEFEAARRQGPYRVDPGEPS